jgi:hypothetical protein
MLHIPSRSVSYLHSFKVTLAWDFWLLAFANGPRNNNFLFRFEPKLCFDSVSVFFAKLKKIPVHFGFLEPFRNEPKQKISVSKQTETED